METISTSPTQIFPPQTDSLEIQGAFDALLQGKKVRRQEWPDDGTYLAIRDEKVMIFTPDDKTFHPLILSTGDLIGTDWVVISQNS